MVRSLRASHWLAALATTAALLPLGAQTPTIPVAEEFERLHFRSIGPVVMSGRIADLAVYERNPAVFYVGTAHGGVWKTTSNGATFEPLFQDKGLMSIGDVTISQTNPDLLWVGTGESNNRQSISFGSGVWKSTDGGKTFAHMGLPKSSAIHRIVIDPTNNNVVLVAATGPLFGPGGDRGVFKTTDGGATWKQVLKGDDDTGASDLVMSATDPKTLYASMYQRRRTTCCFNGGGPGSGIFKSTDGGETWTKLQGGGLPGGSLGRIGLDVFRKSSAVVYAQIEGPSGRGLAAPAEMADAPPPVAGGGGRGGAGGGAQAGVTGIYRSDDGGATWRKVSSTNPRPMYFSKIQIDPNNPDRIYMGGVGLHMSNDGGATFATDAAMAIHDDVHAIWVDPANENHVLIGNDGGLAVTYDMAKTWTFTNNLPVGLFYHVSYDMEYPYNICGGMQDNYNWCGPSASRFNRGIMPHEWFQILGGDGFVAIPDLRDSRIVYTESQDGNIIRRNKVTGESKSIRPNASNVATGLAAGEALRFHWDTPLMFSPHDPGTLMAAANRIFISKDRGDSWTVISPDLTQNKNRNDIVTMGQRGSEITISRNDGISQWPAIVAMAESPAQAGVYYAGTDDGTVSMTRDGGKTWTNITSRMAGFPAGGYVSRVVPSKFAAGTVYITVDNHRENDMEPYIWLSTDFGATFRAITAGLKGENVRTLTEDIKNPDVLYIGTETGIFLTLDRGQTWRRLQANFPTVRVDELTIHPRENALLVASHGRAIWVLDHLEPIQEFRAAQQASADAKLFSVPTALQWKTKDDRNDEFWGHNYFLGENPPTDAVIQLHLKKAVPDLKLRISDASGKFVRDIPVPAARNQPGIQTVCWDQRHEPIAAVAGPPAGAPPGAGGRGGAGGGAPGAGGRGGAAGAGAAIPGVPQPIPSAGYLPENPCGGAGGGGFGGFGGGGGGAAPYVAPGAYTVALMAGDRELERKPMRIVMDPEVRFTAQERARYQEILLDLHEMQRTATPLVAALTSLNAQMDSVVAKSAASGASDAVKAQVTSLKRDLDAVKVKFGVGAALPAFGGGGRGGAPADPANVFGRAGTLKGAIGGIWEMPSAALVAQYTEVKAALPRAITEANGVLTRARAASEALKSHNVTLTVPTTTR
jgi:photosystem II stability/assembly factor-like uncharacterized protein